MRALEEFRFEADVARAETLPASWYLGDERFALEQERVFGRTWQLVGRESLLSAPGAVLEARVAGEPLLVLRDPGGEPRALSAVCRHRAGPVRAVPGGRSLRCGYHGWSYDLEGRLAAAPELDGVRDFDRDGCRLPAFRVETWAGFVFVNLDAGAGPLAEALGSIAEETGHLPLAAMRPYRRADYEVDCNWKVYVDNYLEGYHIPQVHPRLFRELDYAAYRVETARHHSRQHAPFRSSGEGTLYAGRDVPEARYYWVFPGTMLNLYPDNVQTNAVIPLGPERTLVRFEWSLLDPEGPDAAAAFEEAFALADEVQQEDAAICTAVQRGLRSRHYDRGRYSARRENGVHHFHGLLVRQLAGA